MAAAGAHPVFKIAGHDVDLSGHALPSSVEIVHEVPEAFQQYSALRTELKDFDATVVVGDQTIQGHKALLSARIPFFRGLFDSNMAESASGKVTITQFDFTTVSALLDYVYTGKLTVDAANVQDLLMAANFLGIEPVQLACGKFMSKRLRVETALPVLLMCRSIGYHAIDDYVLRFLDKNFVCITHTPEFLNLTAGELEGLLRRDSIKVDEEKQVFDAITLWMSANEERKKYAESLLRCVRVARIPEDQITVVLEQTPWVAASEACMALLKQEKEARENPVLRAEMQAFDSKERRCDESHDLIFAVGLLSSVQNPTDSTMAFYEPIANKWTPCENLPGVRGRNGVAIVGDKVFAIAGSDGKERLKTTDVYDVKANQWGKAAELNQHRAGIATGVIDGKIYVAGGFDGSNALDSVEVLNTKEAAPEWVALPTKMTKVRGCPASCVFNGLLYVIGGHDGQGIHKDGEFYNPETDTWTAMAPMKYKRCRFGAAVYQGHIYVVGGFDGAAFLRDVERYDPHTNTWTVLKQIKERRSRATVAVSCGKLYVFGGFDGLNNVPSVEMYQPETNTWVKREDMPSHAGGIFVGSFSIPSAYPSPVANLEADDIQTA